MKKSTMYLGFILCLLNTTLLSGGCVEDELFDPYPEIYDAIEILPQEIKGWHRYEFFFGQLIKTKKIETFVEVGVWLGNVTTYIGELLDEGSKIYAVDHFLGSSEHQYIKEYHQYVPTLYQQFLSNIIHKKLQHKVVPVRMPSLEASKLFIKHHKRADIVYIDASHEYEYVAQDLRAWYPIVKNGGVLCGDDWHLGGVRKAVMEFAKRKGLKLYAKGSLWSFYPVPELPLIEN